MTNYEIYIQNKELIESYSKYALKIRGVRSKKLRAEIKRLKTENETLSINFKNDKPAIAIHIESKLNFMD